MLYVRPLSDNELSDLEKLTQQAVGRVAERSWYVLMSNKGKSVPEICEIFNRHPNCVRKWIKRYQAQGINGIQDIQRSGRPPKVNEQTKEKIDEIFKKTGIAERFVRRLKEMLHLRTWINIEELLIILEQIALTERQTKIVEHIISNGRITSSEFQKMFKISRQAAHKEINKLIELSLIEPKGTGKSIYYVLK